MRDVAFRVRVRLENEHGVTGFVAAVGNIIHQMCQQAEKEGILSAGAAVASAHLLSVEIISPQLGDIPPPTPEISVGGEVEKSSSPET